MNHHAQHPSVQRRARAVKALLLDVDGVLTDGGMSFDAHGNEWKRFHVHDGLGVKLAQAAGMVTGLVSARDCAVVRKRAEDLGMPHIHLGAMDKRKALEQITAETGIAMDAVCFVGDDLPDVPVLCRVGLAVAVGNAVQEVKAHAHYITQLKGGDGAVRETVELILSAQGVLKDAQAKLWPL